MLKKKPKTVADKAIELILRHNKNNGESSDDSAEDELPKHEVDFDEYDVPAPGATDIRKKNIKLLSDQSARYQGKIATRKHDEETDEADSGSEEASSTQDVTYQESDSEADEINGAKESAENSTDHDDEESDAGEEFDDEESETDEASTDEDAQNKTKKMNFLAAEKNRQAEKGMCVQNQLKIWEKLLELRINSQKLLSKANQLPYPLSGADQQNDNIESSTGCVEKAATLLNSLLCLQNTLFMQFPELKSAMSNTLKRPLPLQSHNGDGAPPTKRFADELQQRFREMNAYRNAVLLKWDDRTKLLTPGAGAKKKMLTEEYDVIRKIDNTLLGRSALIEKSQTTLKHDSKSTENAAIQRNPQIYDDSDFYHQQLRELIEYKTSTTQNNADVMKQYVELQQLRQKMKKKVDTRASKGRKLRYVTHNKLVNFMAPQIVATAWTQESKDELYKSLFLS